jgi:D-xylose transport system ATP-binding protein
VGKRQMVEIAKALAEDAQLLILDEPSSALTDTEVKTLMEILTRLRQEGKTCIYISHKLEEVFAITDAITVLRDGKTADTVVTADTTTDEVITLMVGREMTERFPASTRQPGVVLLSVEGLCLADPDKPGQHRVAKVSFELRQGEILGVAGLMGSGRSEMVNALFGTYGAAVTGALAIDGQPVSINAVADAMALGMALVPEDRKSLGLITEQSILSNIALPNLERFAGFASLNKHAELQACEEMARQLAVKAPTLHALVQSLSGGNQQKVVIAKWLLASPRILILDEPTRGIDVGAKFEIYKLMNQLASEGVAVLMVSSELPEILGMSDRILVMQEGRCAGILRRGEATQEKIMALATGTRLHAAA